MSSTFIYGLVDPRDDEVRYVGKSNDPLKRFVAHAGNIWDHGSVIRYASMVSEKFLWVHELRLSGLRPRLVILEKCDLNEHRERERHWIERLSRNGRYLVNGTIYKSRGERNRLQKKYMALRNLVYRR